MQIEVRIDPDCTEPRVIVCTDRLTDEVRTLLDRIGTGTPQRIVGMIDEEAHVLDPQSLVRIYAEAGRVYAVANGKVYVLRGPLYEWEQRLDPHTFVRISQSEIISLKQVNGFDLSLAGTICVRLSDGTDTYASRRYVSKIKTLLGL